VSGIHQLVLDAVELVERQAGDDGDVFIAEAQDEEDMVNECAVRI